MTRHRQFRAQTPGSTRRAAARARRGDRLPALLGLTPAAVRRLDKLTVMVVGTGSVGATSALGLSRLQIGRLLLVDRGRFKPTSLLTQPVGSDALGRPKASHIAERCRDISPGTEVQAWDGALQDLPLADMVDVDLVVLAGDNLTVARDTAQRCLNLGLPLLHAAVHGETLTAQCRFFAGGNAAGPCPVCLFSAAEFRLMEEERVWSCEGAHNNAAAGQSPVHRPTMSVRSLCGLAGDMATLLVTRWALQLGSPVHNTMTETCAYTWRSFVSPLRRNHACPLQHEKWVLARAPRPLADLTVAELLGSASRRSGQGTIAVRQHRWIERGLCGCTEPAAVHRFVRVGEPAARRCPRCQRPVFPQPFYSHDSAPASLLAPWMDRTLGKLGAGRCRDVLVTHGTRGVLFVHPTTARTGTKALSLSKEPALSLSKGPAKSRANRTQP